MLRVASLVQFLEKHWVGEIKVDWDFVTEVALLHDLGNIVKFDFDKHPEFLGQESNNIDYWRKQQSAVIEKYGSDDDKATKQMLSELGLDGQISELIYDKRFGNTFEIEKSTNWELKILYYADLRTLPNGIGSLQARLEDIRQRMSKYTSRPDFEDLVRSCLNIGRQVERNLDISAEQINQNAVLTNSALLNVALST